MCSYPQSKDLAPGPAFVPATGGPVEAFPGQGPVALAHYAEELLPLLPGWSLLTEQQKANIVCRLDKALPLVPEYGVIIARHSLPDLLSGGAVPLPSQRKAGKLYSVSIAGGCSCPDCRPDHNGAIGAPLGWCKHRLALVIAVAARQAFFASKLQARTSRPVRVRSGDAAHPRLSSSAEAFNPRKVHQVTPAAQHASDLALWQR